MATWGTGMAPAVSAAEVEVVAPAVRAAAWAGNTHSEALSSCTAAAMHRAVGTGTGKDNKGISACTEVALAWAWAQVSVAAWRPRCS